MSSIETTRAELKKLPDAYLTIVYSLTKYHERYKMTKLIHDELTARNFTNTDIQGIDANFTDLYQRILNGEVS